MSPGSVARAYVYWVGDRTAVTVKVPLYPAGAIPAMTTVWPTCTPLGEEVVIVTAPADHVAVAITMGARVAMPPDPDPPGLVARV